jgi:hypothetical protein
MYRRHFDLSVPFVGIIVVLIVFIIGSHIYNVWTGEIGPNGCPKGQKAISGYQGGRYTHLCVEPGASLPVAPY